MKCHTVGDIPDVYRETLQQWSNDGESKIIDLKSFYLQLCVAVMKSYGNINL